TRNGERALEICTACDEPSCGNFSAISPFMRLISASYHRSLVVSTAVIASPMQRQASSNWPSSAWALDKCAKKNGKYTLELVDRYVVIPELIIWIASEALPTALIRNLVPSFPTPSIMLRPSRPPTGQLHWIVRLLLHILRRGYW